MSPSSATSEDLLRSAAKRLAEVPGFMAYLLSLAFSGDVTPRRISTELGCAETMAVRLCLMKAPRPDRQEFTSDIAAIAASTGIERIKLLSVVRQARALETFGESNEMMLMAARDRLPTDDEPDGQSR